MRWDEIITQPHRRRKNGICSRQVVANNATKPRRLLLGRRFPANSAAVPIAPEAQRILPPAQAHSDDRAASANGPASVRALDPRVLAFPFLSLSIKRPCASRAKRARLFSYVAIRAGRNGRCGLLAASLSGVTKTRALWKFTSPRPRARPAGPASAWLGPTVNAGLQNSSFAPARAERAGDRPPRRPLQALRPESQLSMTSAAGSHERCQPHRAEPLANLRRDSERKTDRTSPSSSSDLRRPWRPSTSGRNRSRLVPIGAPTRSTRRGTGLNQPSRARRRSWRHQSAVWDHRCRHNPPWPGSTRARSTTP